jgi:hypothetical protein
MTASNEDVYRRAVGRILRFMKILTAIGTLVAFAWRGGRAGVGFLFGAAIAWIGFLFLKRMVDSLGAAPPKASTRGAVLLGSRYLILGGLAYAILRLTGVNTLAAVTGLFVSLAAVLIEILFELVYARD